jgi:uncharacterized repeat protein (TIGR02543 family)
MASCQTTRWQTTSPIARLTVTESASTGATSTLAWVLEYYSGNAANTDVGKPYSVVIGGETVASGSYDIDGKTGWNTVASGTKVVTKRSSAHTVAFSLSFSFNMYWSGSYCGTQTASGSISVAAETTYTVSYNANGGTGAPGKQTKWAGVTLTLSDTKPTRTGYTFLNWLSSAQNKTYAPGAFYGYDASTTMTAQWEVITYTVKYNANGGSGAPANQTKTYGTALKLSSTIPTRENYNFKGWGTSASSTTIAYAAGASYTKNAGITLYAIWELAYVKPRITGFSVSRCNSSGALSDSGTYALVKFAWACDKAVSSIKIAWSGGSSGSATVSASGTSGNVSQVVGGGGFSTDHTYKITATVTDSGGSTEASTTLPGTAYVMDFLSGGKGIAFGKPAEKEGIDFGWTVYDKFGALMGNGLAAYGGGGDNGIDPDTTLEELCLTSHSHGPEGLGKWYFIRTAFYSAKSTGAARAQIAFTYNKYGPIYHRYFYDGAWLPWHNQALESYPVNSVYIGYSHISPASLFGGTWTRIEGRVLYACASSGTIGATGTHTTGSGSSSLPYINVGIWRRTA